MEFFASCPGLWLSRKAQKVEVAGLPKRCCAELEYVQPRAMESIMRGCGFRAVA